MVCAKPLLHPRQKKNRAAQNRILSVSVMRPALMGSQPANVKNVSEHEDDKKGDRRCKNQKYCSGEVKNRFAFALFRLQCFMLAQGKLFLFVVDARISHKFCSMIS